ncbi:hypothetical protein Droror1_Dr00022979 [Drosera rotundifolia]
MKKQSRGEQHLIPQLPSDVISNIMFLSGLYVALKSYVLEACYGDPSVVVADDPWACITCKMTVDKLLVELKLDIPNSRAMMSYQICHGGLDPAELSRMRTEFQKQLRDGLMLQQRSPMQTEAFKYTTKEKAVISKASVLKHSEDYLCQYCSTKRR